jgi:hypothetical protein
MKVGNLVGNLIKGTVNQIKEKEGIQLASPLDQLYN